MKRKNMPTNQQPTKQDLDYFKDLLSTMDKPFEIYSNTTIHFSFKDRLRILFGVKVHINTTIFAHKEIEIYGNKTKVNVIVERIIARKPKGYAEVTDNPIRRHTMTKGFLSTEDTIIEFESTQGLKDEFRSLYMYALYVCGGDFSSFNDVEKLQEAIENTTDKFKLFEL